MAAGAADYNIGLFGSHIFVDIGLNLSYIQTIEALVILEELISPSR